MTTPAPSSVGSQEPSQPYVAALDLGSNSFHMVVARLDEHGLEIVDRLREPVRFAACLDDSRNITPAGMEKAIQSLERFGQRIKAMPPDRVRIVGTNTLRQAKNSLEFMERARQALGHPVEVVSGTEEARLIYLGVAQTMPDEGRRLVVDIGGGSTEVIIGDRADIVTADSLYMGCVSFSMKFFGDGRLKEKGFREAQLAAELELQSIAQPYRRIGWERAVGCSGTIQAVQEIVRANAWSEEGITLKGLKKLRKALIAAEDIEKLELPGLTPDRRGVIAGGAAILEAIFEDLRIEHMLPSPGAMREGVLYDLVGRIRHEDVRERTIRRFQERYQVDPEQAARVEQTAASLLDQARNWELDELAAGRTLAWAARLHEIGLAISHTGWHKHGGYLVTHAHMAGFSREEQLTLAALLYTQRRKLRQEAFALLDPSRLPTIRKLAVLFRLAVCLNRSRDPERPTPVLKAKKEKVKLFFPTGWLDAHSLTAIALQEEARYLASAGYELQVQEATAGAEA
jgi:exopolyphosphatase / guanosine-5'-triphosphate,3'-diphosphate pyrophosphatase